MLRSRSYNSTFPFQAGDANFPQHYLPRDPLDDSDLHIMEISSVDGSASALFQVRETEAYTSNKHRIASAPKMEIATSLPACLRQPPNGSQGLESALRKAGHWTSRGRS